MSNDTKLCKCSWIRSTKSDEPFDILSQTNMFIQVLNESQIALTSAGFVPSVSPFPTEEATRERRFEKKRRKDQMIDV